MKWNRIICIVLSLAAVFSLLMIRDSMAWVNTVTGTPPNSVIHVKKMAFSFDGTLGSYLQYTTGNNAGDSYVVTEQNLIVTNGGKITVTNHSTIATEARFKITYEAIDPSTHTKETRTYTAAETDSLYANIDSHWIQKDSDGYFYYYSAPPVTSGENQSDGTEGFAAPEANATPSAVDAITEIKYLDELFVNGTDVLAHSDYFPSGGDPFSGSVHVVFEAKQADSVDWTQITSWATT